MNCPQCNKKMGLTDTTYSNINTNRASVEQHTGDIYECKGCEELFIDDFLTGKLGVWWGY